jgi:hypothetical protein
VAPLRPNLGCDAVCVIGLVALNDDVVRIGRRAVDDMTGSTTGANHDVSLPIRPAWEDNGVGGLRIVEFRGKRRRVYESLFSQGDDTGTTVTVDKAVAAEPRYFASIGG